MELFKIVDISVFYGFDMSKSKFLILSRTCDKKRASHPRRQRPGMKFLKQLYSLLKSTRTLIAKAIGREKTKLQLVRVPRQIPQETDFRNWFWHHVAAPHVPRVFRTHRFQLLASPKQRHRFKLRSLEPVRFPHRQRRFMVNP